MAATSTPSSACESPLGTDSVTFMDGNERPSQTDYPEVYSYWLQVVSGPCPPTHVDITVTGFGIVGGVRARMEASPEGVRLLAEPEPHDPESGTWSPNVRRGQLLGTVTRAHGRAAGLVLPASKKPNDGLPVFHADRPLPIEEEP